MRCIVECSHPIAGLTGSPSPKSLELVLWPPGGSTEGLALTGLPAGRTGRLPQVWESEAVLSGCLCHGRTLLCRASLRALWDLASAQREGPFPHRPGPEMGVKDGDSSQRSIASTTGQTDAARGTWSAQGCGCLAAQLSVPPARICHSCQDGDARTEKRQCVLGERCPYSLVDSSRV